MYTTRTQVVAALIQLGMSEPYAKVAVDQQYNYDEIGDTADLLRGNEDDLSVSHSVSDEEIVSVKFTWDEILSTEGDAICVDREPMYDLNGEPL